MDYGRQIYTVLRNIYQYMQDWKADTETWQNTLQTMLQSGFDLLFCVICIIAVFSVVSVAMRLFFPDYRD